MGTHATPERSGMVALVYYGTIDDNNVVVKVKRRNIEDKLEDALNKMRFVVKVASYLPWLNRLYLPTIFEENRQDMINQVDFSNEVRNLSVYKKNFRHMDFVKIPNVYDILQMRMIELLLWKDYTVPGYMILKVIKRRLNMVLW